MKKAAAVFIIILMMVFFALLVKVKGELSYVPNFFIKTEGSLPAEVYSVNTGSVVDSGIAASALTSPDRFIKSFLLRVNSNITDQYSRKPEIFLSKDYLEAFPGHEGIITFRGNYLRNRLSFGYPDATGAKLSSSWEYQTGRFLKNDGVNYWSGNGWTGQPLAVRWSDEWKSVMNLNDNAKNYDGLVEIIYPGMDGKIHFLNIDNGEETRDAINVGMIFKGTCSLHPEYPLLVCGAGDRSTGQFGEQICARIFIYSLIDGTLLYEFGANDEAATRSWHGFDSSPIFAVEADSLIYPGENGVLYTVHLNTFYDSATRKLTVNPDETVKYTYSSYAAAERYELSENGNGSGSESSAAIWNNYLFFGDNGGIFQCLDLNTMKPVWVQDLLEDINSSPVLEFAESGEAFIYVGTTLKYHFNRRHTGEACIYKLNALSGEIIWKKPYEVHTVLGLAGGILSSGASGTGTVSDYIYYAVSKTPKVNSGYIVALSKASGEEYWRIDLPCDAWSSGCLVYLKDGSARLVQCCGNGDMLLIDAASGDILDRINFGSNIESTPVIFEDKIVVGLRSEYIVSAYIR